MLVSSSHQSMATPNVRPQGVSKNVYFFTIALVAMVGFVAGTRGGEILSAVAPVLGFKVETGQLDLSSVQRTYQQLSANYDGDIDTKKLIDGASRGLAAAAGDQYTVFMDAEEAKSFNNDLSGDIGGGVGAEIGVRSNQPTIIRVLPGNPAEKAGLLAGDVVTAINGKPMVDAKSSDVASKIRGEIGTSVKITVARAGQARDFSVTRAAVTNPSVRSEIKDGVGIMTLSRFDGETSRLSRQAAQDFKKNNVSSVILDLRGNGGGFLSSAQDVAGLWLDNKVVVSERVDGKVSDELKSGGNPVLTGVPTVVLVDGGSASASEIVAGALQDHKAATLTGERTYGKGTVQRVIDMAGGAQLKVTIARWYTPNGKNITKDGITPDSVVKLSPEDANGGRDPQLESAIKHLKQ